MTHKIKVKLCGFREAASLACAIEQKVDFVGFVFHDKSVRNIDHETAQELARIIPSSIPKVAVLKDARLDEVDKAAQSLEPQYFQLHGTQTIDDILAIKKSFPKVKIIKAFGIAKKSDIEQTLDFSAVADIFLFDNSISGSGQIFDWNLLQDFRSEKAWFLSGGLNSKNILEALKITNASMVDISSGIEKERGVKSPELIVEFMTKIKNAG